METTNNILLASLQQGTVFAIFNLSSLLRRILTVNKIHFFPLYPKTLVSGYSSQAAYNSKNLHNWKWCPCPWPCDCNPDYTTSWARKHVARKQGILPNNLVIYECKTRAMVLQSLHGNKRMPVCFPSLFRT